MLAGTIDIWFLIPHIEHQRLYLVGLGVILTILLAGGFIGLSDSIDAISWASDILIVIFVVTYNLTVCPGCYCLIAEIPTTCLHIKTAVLARNIYNIISIGANFLNTPILNPEA